MTSRERAERRGGSTSENPYVGPRPFEAGESDLFFGRVREISELRSLITAHRSVVLYAQSGAGKTSLLHAGLLPALREEGFEVMPVARVSGFIDDRIPLHQVDNVYALNAILSWLEGERGAGTTPPSGAAQSEFLSTTLHEYLRGVERPTDELGMPAPRVLVFDQFEELFTAYPGRWSDRQGFFLQLRAAFDGDPARGLKGDPLLRVLFVIREDHIAELDPYARLMPENLRTRFRMERLGERAALAAVEGPLTGRTRAFKKGVAQRLVEDLLEVRVQASDGSELKVKGQYIEPVQLQVVCETLWSDLPAGVVEITEDHLYHTGGPDEALLRFYERGLSTAAAATEVTEGTLRNWFEQVLLTPAGTRGTAFRGQDETGGIPNAAVDLLEDMHLIRAESRGGARWYELSHDRFIQPVRRSNQQWLSQRGDADLARQWLEEQADAWDEAGRGRAGLFSAAMLVQAEGWLDTMAVAELTPSERVRALMEASRGAVQRGKLRQRAAFGMAMFSMFAVVAAILAWVERGNARDQAKRAASSESIAIVARDSADSARARAERSELEALAARDSADSARARAERSGLEALAARDSADSAKVRAVASGLVSRIYELTVAAQRNLDRDPELAMILAFEAATLGRSRPDAARQPLGPQLDSAAARAATVLRSALDSSYVTGTHKSDDVTAAAFADTSAVVFGTERGAIFLWNLAANEAHQIASQSGPIVDVVASRNRKYVESSRNRRDVAWSSQDNTTVLRADGQIVHTPAAPAPVRALSFNPDTSRRELATADSAVRIWDYEKGDLLRVLHTLGEVVVSLTYALEPTPRVMATADSVGGTIRFWRSNSGRRIQTWTLASSIRAIALSPDGSQLAAITGEGDSLIVTSTVNWQRTIVQSVDSARSLAFSPASVMKPDSVVLLAVAAAGNDGYATVTVYALGARLTPRRILRGHRGIIRDMDFSADGRALVTVGSDSTVRTWSLGKQEELPSTLDALLLHASERITRGLTARECQDYFRARECRQ